MSDEIKTKREQMLHRAAEIIKGDRDAQYGGPEDSFTHIAAYWTQYLAKTHGLSTGLQPEDVAVMMVLLKVARLETGGRKQPDTWTDIAGYAGCGYEISERES